MTKLFDVIVPEAQQDLIRDNVIELVTVSVEALPHPDRPDDLSAMQIAAEVYYDFRDGIPRIDNALGRIRRTMSLAEDDLSPETKSRLLADLAKQRRDNNEFREGKVNGELITSHFSPEVADLLRPELFDLDPKVTVWCHGWTAGMDDSGLMCIDCDRPFIFEGIDDESRAQVLKRVHQVNAGIGRIVEPLMREG
jgi:hypothetical protein